MAVEQNRKVLLQGNEALARGLVENGCTVVTSYPGTPASEILSSIQQWQQAEDAAMHVEWGDLRKFE